MTTDRSARVGRWVWCVAAVAYPLLQLWVVNAWPVPYDILHHTVSDLGYTTCGAEDRPGGLLQTCSPRHAVHNVGGLLLCVAVAVGAWLLRAWWGRGLRRCAVLALFAVVSLAGIGTAVVPGDVDINAHTLLAVPLFLGQIAVLALLAVHFARTDRMLAVAAGVAATVSVLGMIALIFALAGHGWVGVTERLAAETFWLWILFAGIRGHRPRVVVPPTCSDRTSHTTPDSGRGVVPR